MDTREWLAEIEKAKKQDVDTKERFNRDLESDGIEYAAQWQLDRVTDARVNLAWWLRIEKHLAEGMTADLVGIEEVVEAAHDAIIDATTHASTNPIANAIKAAERDALARWYKEAAWMLRQARRDAAAPAAAEGTK